MIQDLMLGLVYLVYISMNFNELSLIFLIYKFCKSQLDD